jgi:CRP/FNR family transcriptional regulator, cyclic AMP receptor protein
MVNPSSINIHAFLQPTVFGRLGAEPLMEIAAFAKIERFEMPTLLNAAGTHLQWLRLVLEGSIEIIARSTSGKEVTVGDVGLGGWATWLPCFVPVAPEHDFYCSAPSCFIKLPISEVRHFCERYPQTYPWIITEIGQRLRLLMEWTGQSVLVGPEQRMAKLIHILARDQKIKLIDGTLHVTQHRLASLARCSRQSANALLGALEKRGLIQLAYGKCAIPDLVKLAVYAEHEQIEMR